MGTTSSNSLPLKQATSDSSDNQLSGNLNKDQKIIAKEMYGKTFDEAKEWLDRVGKDKYHFMTRKQRGTTEQYIYDCIVVDFDSDGKINIVTHG
jgi:ribosomal protein L22